MDECPDSGQIVSLEAYEDDTAFDLLSSHDQTLQFIDFNPEIE